MNLDWPFKESPEFPVYTTVEVLTGQAPILFVTHDSDDGAWQFHSSLCPDMSKAEMVELGELVKLDPSITEVANLPLGAIAFRGAPGEKWTKSKKAI